MNISDVTNPRDSQSLNHVSATIDLIQTLDAADRRAAKRLLLVLRIYRHVLMNRCSRVPVDFDWLMTMKHSVRESEIMLDNLQQDRAIDLLDWYSGCKPNNSTQEFANLLCNLILQVTIEIDANEDLYPEMKFAFDRERSRYRKLKNDADEALQLN